MFGLNFVELLVIALVVLVLFGNRLPQVLGDLGKGVKAFKEGMDSENGATAMRGQRAAPAPRKVAARKAPAGKKATSKASATRKKARKA